MKKAISILISMILIVSGIACAFADGSDWYCPTCGTHLSGDYSFCYNDATPRPGNTGSSYSGNGAGTSRPWPSIALGGTRTEPSKKDPEYRIQAFHGPNKSYSGAGAYKIKKIVALKVLFSEGGFVYVDVQYKTVGRRCVYFQKGELKVKDAQELNLTPHPATTTGSVEPQLGPGYGYAAFTEGALAGGTSISVFFETDGWVFAEFNCSVGKARGWLPESQVRAN